MERRENQDLIRNSLVSGIPMILTTFIVTDINPKHHHNAYKGFTGFLRALENCQSILFLTTNRSGSFDDAFVSRIHIPLYYREFTQNDRLKVWKIFLDKLARDRKNVMNIPAETILYTTELEVTSLKWNGREIRNGEWLLLYTHLIHTRGCGGLIPGVTPSAPNSSCPSRFRRRR